MRATAYLVCLVLLVAWTRPFERKCPQTSFTNFSDDPLHSSLAFFMTAPQYFEHVPYGTVRFESVSSTSCALPIHDNPACRANRARGSAPATYLQAETPDRLESPERAEAATLEQVFDLHRARTLVKRALEVVRNDYASSGRADHSTFAGSVSTSTLAVP